MKVAITGHRPGRLAYHGLSFTISKEWRKVINWLKDKFVEENVTDVYCGMAEGCDIAAGIAAYELANEMYTIKLHCILPYKNYNNRIRWHYILKEAADEWVELSDEFYRGCDNVRDQYIVDHCDKLIAIWDGIPSGGVWSTIRKAEKKDKEIIYYPKEEL